MIVLVNLKNNSTEKLDCANVKIDNGYLVVSGLIVEDLFGKSVFTRYYRLVNVLSYDVVEDK